MLNVADILAAARTARPEPTCSICGERDPNIPCSCAGREAVKALCAGLTDEQLRAEIEALVLVCLDCRQPILDCCGCAGGMREPHEMNARRARAALETERDRRSLAALEAS